MTPRKDTQVICALASAVVHLKEYIDTDEPLDLVAAETALGDFQLRQWIRLNHALIPVRRDAKEFYE